MCFRKQARSGRWRSATFAILNGIVAQRNFLNEDADDVVADAERVRAPMKRKNAEIKTSRYRGVCWQCSAWHKTSKKWRVQIRDSGKQKTIGLFADEDEAKHSYDAYAIAHAIDVKRNFPEDG